jgi:hypothetical protein
VSQLCAGSGGELDPVDTGRVQGFGRGPQGRAGRDDIVDKQHGEAATRTPRPEGRANETIGARFAGLRRTVGPIQEPPARNTQLACNGLGNRLCLVVAASADPTGTRGRPRDHVDVVEAEPSDHVRRKDARRGSMVTELEGDDQLTRHAVERERGRDAVGTAHRCDRRKSEPAAVAQSIANTPAGTAPTGKQHGGINTRGV